MRLDEIMPLRGIDQWKGSVRTRYVLITAQELSLLKRAVRQLGALIPAHYLKHPGNAIDPDVLALLEEA